MDKKFIRLVESMIKVNDLIGLDIIIREYNDTDQILILIMDTAILFQKLKVVRHLYINHDKYTVSLEIIEKTMREYPKEYIDEIKLLIIEMDLEKIKI